MFVPKIVKVNNVARVRAKNVGDVFLDTVYIICLLSVSLQYITK